MPESLPPELVALRERMGAFVEELRAIEGGLRDGSPVPDEVQRQVRDRSKALGFFGMTQSRDVGGSDAGPLAMTVARETLAAGNSILARYVFGPDPGLLRHTSGEQKARYLDPVLAGERAWAFAFTEPSGPDAPARPTWATRAGDDLLVSGRKTFVSRGNEADFYATLVNIDAEGDLPGGAAMVLIDRDATGVTLTREFRSLEGGTHVDLSFEDVRVPAANILGGVGEGMPRALGNIQEERLASAAHACGIAIWATEFVTRHIMGGHRSGARLADREGVRLRYSDMRIDTYAMRSVLYRTARIVEGSDPSTSDAINEVSAAKVFCTEGASRIVDTAVQLVGGQALIEGHPLERLYRRVRSSRIGGGASDILRLNVARGIIEFDSGRL